MAEERPPILRREPGPVSASRVDERGASLILVLIALAALMPLAMMLADLVSMRQRQVTGFQQNLGGQAAVRAGLDLALTRLQSRQITLGSAQAERFELKLAPRPVRVRVSRQSDAILAMDGSVIDPEGAAGLDLESLVLDPVAGGVIRRYRRLEVYLVEAECSARYPFAAVRLLAVVGRLDEGVLCLGVRYDRGYFP